MLSKKYKGIFVFLIALGAITTQYNHPSLIKACMPDSGPWFTRTLNLDGATVPEGFLFAPDPDSENTFGTVRYSGKDPIYILVPRQPDYPQTVTEDTIPAEYFPVYKLVNEQVFVFRSNIYNKLGRYSWEPETKAEIDSYLLEQNGVKLTNAYDQSRTERRPDNVSLPNPVEIHIPILITKQVRTINGTLTYTLNPHYDPVGAERCYKHLELVQKNWEKRQQGLVQYITWRHPHTAWLFLATTLSTILLGLKLKKEREVNSRNKRAFIMAFALSLCTLLFVSFILLIYFSTY